MNMLFQKRITGCEPFHMRCLVQDILDRIQIWRVLSDEDLYEIRLILNELIANGTIHGNKGACTKGITATVHAADNDTLCITVQDDGIGFDHQGFCSELYAYDSASLSERGRGLKLIRAMCDDMQFNQRGNVIRIHKSIRQNSYVV